MLHRLGMLAVLVVLVAGAASAATPSEPAGQAAKPAPAAGTAAGKSTGRVKVVVAVLPFEVHSSRSLGYLEGSLADLLSSRLEASGAVQVVQSVTVRQTLVGYPGERTEDAVRHMARDLGADWVVVGSLTELAGHYSLDVRIIPVDARASSATMVLTADGDDELLDRINELSSRILAVVGAAGAAGRVADVEVRGLPAVEDQARAAIQTHVGSPYDSAVIRQDLAALRKLPGVATATVETQHGKKGVTVVFHLVPAAEIMPEMEAGKGTQRVAEIKVTGNKRVESNAILARIGTKVGQPLSPGQVADDVRSVYGLGFFRNVQVLTEKSPRGLIVTFAVKENPVIREVTVSGNKAISSDKIRDALTITTGSTLDYPLLFENRARIEALYRAKGYYLAKVRYEIENLPADAVAIHFDVEENGKLRLIAIKFEGNHHFTDSELEKGFKTRTWHWYSYVTHYIDKSGTYAEPVFLQDLQGITNKYLDAGFIHIEVGEPDVMPTKDGLIVTVKITEGDQYHVGKVDVRGDETVDIDAMRGKLKLKEGAVFDRSYLNDDLKALEHRYTDRGFFMAKVSPITRVDDDKKTVGIVFQIEKGPLYFLRHIDITGNSTTIDPVIRRQIDSVEGELYSARSINKSKIRVKSLGFFEDVDFEPKQTDHPDQLDLDVKVVEHPTGSLSFGAGYSSQDGFVLSGSVSQTNLFGRGYGGSLSADIGTQTQRFFLNLQDAYFLGSNFGLSASIFDTDLQFQSFQQKQMGFDLALSHALDDKNQSRGFLRYSFASRKLAQSTSVNAASPIFREIYNSSTTSSLLGLTYRSDTRNDRVAPSSGHVVEFSLDGAGLGGFSKFARMEGRTSFFFGVPDWFPSWFPARDKSAFAISIRAGWAVPFNSIGDWSLPQAQTGAAIAAEAQPLSNIDTNLTLPLSERYFLGGLGSYQLRGFKARSVGPRRAILKQNGIVGTNGVFSPTGWTQSSGSYTSVGAPAQGTWYCANDPKYGIDYLTSQGNGSGKCNSLSDKKISDFQDLSATDVIGGNKFVSTSLEYRFPISETLGLMGIVFFDSGNAFAENQNIWDLNLWRMGTGFGVLWFSPFGPLQAFIGFPIDRLPVEDAQVFEFSVGGSNY